MDRLPNRMTSAIIALYLVVAILFATLTTSTAKPIDDAITFPFPRVYKAEIMTSEKDPSIFSRFPAEVDLLSFIPITEKTSSLSFIVEDEDELARLTALAKTPKSKTIGGKIDFDAAATEELHNQINGQVMIESIPSVYSTIANYPCYKNLQGSFDWMDAMVQKAQTITGLSVTKTDIGDSYLKTKNPSTGYDMWALKITGTAVAGATKAVMFVMSGLHARELAPPELASRWVDSLIDGYGNDAEITAMLDYTEIHLVLQSNPDGRAIAETNPSAMRRKNLNPGTTSTSCSTNTQGVDLNRNFPHQWGLSSGSSSDRCSSTYRGVSAGSEPEVNAILLYTRTIFPATQQNRILTKAYPNNTTGLFLDIHSYGNLVLPPWAYSTKVKPANADALTAIRDKVQYWTNYGNNLGYLASGTTTDFAYGRLGVASVTFELGTAFYQDCSTFENTIYPINLKPLLYLGKISMAPFSMSKGPDITGLNVTESGGVLTIMAAASDSAFSKAKVATTKQKVTEIRAFVNVHPYSYPASALDSTGFVLTNGKVTVDISSLTSTVRYAVYAIAKDSAGFRGPLTSVYFTKM